MLRVTSSWRTFTQPSISPQSARRLLNHYVFESPDLYFEYYSNRKQSSRTAIIFIYILHDVDQLPSPSSPVSHVGVVVSLEVRLRCKCLFSGENTLTRPCCAIHLAATWPLVSQCPMRASYTWDFSQWRRSKMDRWGTHLLRDASWSCSRSGSVSDFKEFFYFEKNNFIYQFYWFSVFLVP